MSAIRPTRRLGIMVPSSNTNAEPTTCAMLTGVPDVTAHFSRFPLPTSLDVTIDADVLGPAAKLLAEAEVEVLAFHGTAGSWTGVEGERRMCHALKQATGIPATTATLATIAALEAIGAERLAMVFPGTHRIAVEIAAEYARHGLTFAHIHSTERFKSNIEMGRLSPGQVEEYVVQGCARDVDAVVVIGTNLAAAPLVERLEHEHDVTIVDSTVATTWHLLRTVGIEHAGPGWGRLFAGFPAETPVDQLKVDAI
jgi:maleate isomerase